MTSSFNFDQVRPVLQILSVMAIVSFIVAAFVGITGFLWFVFAGAIVLLISSFFLERIIHLLEGAPVPGVEAVESEERKSA